MSTPAGSQPALRGEQALAAQVGDRFSADWKNPDHRMRRLLSEFIGTFGLVFVLSAGAAILALYAGSEVTVWQTAFVLSAVSALWLVAAVNLLGDISAHFNPAMTFAFALRRDMGSVMAGIYILVHLLAAACGAFTARAFFGVEGNLQRPSRSQDWLGKPLVLRRS